MPSNQLRAFARNKNILRLRRKYEFLIWKKVFSSKISTQKNRDGKLKILIASNIGENQNILAFDMVLGRALSSRGHDVEVAICGGGFSACMVAEISKFQSVEEFAAKGMSAFCNNCSRDGNKATKLARLKPLPVLKPESVTSQSNKESGEAGAYRFLAVGQKDILKKSRQVLDRFLEAENEYSDAYNKILQNQYDLVIAHHGIYVPQGVVVKACRERNIDIVTWAQGYRKGCFILAWNDTYHKTLIEEKLPEFTLTPSQRNVVQQYLHSRDAGTNDWIRFGISTVEESTPLKLDTSKPIFALFTNVSWDAQIHYSSRVFENMHSWIKETVEWFSDRQHLQLIIRIHPAEETGSIKTRDPIKTFLDANFDVMPSNILVIDAQDSISSYKVMELADFGIIYGTKAGIELATKGVPVVVAGEAWIRNKCIGIEPQSKDDYFDTLERLSAGEDLSPREFRENALRLAYFFFFKRMIQVKSIQPISRYPYIRPRTAKTVKQDLGLTSILESIENKKPFLMKTD